MRVTVAVVALLTAAPAFLAEAAPLQGDPHLVDAAGDAEDGGAREAASGLCGSVVGSCVHRMLPGENNPALDLLSATFVERPSTVEVVIEVAEVTEDLASALGDQGEDAYASAEYAVCWGSGDLDWSTTCSAFNVARRNGNLSYRAAFVVFSWGIDDCFASYCVWQMPWRIEPGSPGRLVVEVPRALLPNGTQGSRLHDLGMTVFKYVSSEAHVPYEVREGVVGINARANPPQGGWVADSAFDEDASFAFATPLLSTPIAWSFSPDTGAIARARERADIDILGVDMVDDARTFTFAVQVARVDATPAPDIGFWLGLGNAGDDAINAGFQVSEGALAPWAGWCARTDCDDLDEDWHVRDVALEVVPGEPGWFNLTFDKVTFNLTDGDLLAYATAELFSLKREDSAVQHGLALTARSWGAWDNTGYLPPYVLGSNLRGTPLDVVPVVEDVAGIRFEDALDDATVPRASSDAQALGQALGDRSEQFDIVEVRAHATSDRDTRITLAIANLQAIEVPKGLDAVVYAVGVQTAAGQFMVGFMKQGGNLPGSTPSQQFFCAQDTAVFQPTPADPLSVVLTDIQGIISVAGGNATGGSGSRGAIVFYVPNTCFAQDQAGPLVVDRLAAGTYAVARTTSAAVTPMDTTDGEHGGVLQAASVAPATPTFWEDKGLDILGLVAAAVTSVGGVLLVARRRGLLKRYLAEVERADERGLVEVRARLKRDLVRGAISEGHFGIVERRLDERLSRSRLEGLKEAFHELPARLLERLQAMLADGRMSAEDHRVFMALLVDAPLTPEAKERVREKLQAWVAKDA